MSNNSGEFGTAEDFKKDIEGDQTKLEDEVEKRNKYANDLENLANALASLVTTVVKALFGESQERLNNSLNQAIETRQKDVNSSNNEIAQSQKQLEEKKEDLSQRIEQENKRIEEMNVLKNSLQFQDDGITNILNEQIKYQTEQVTRAEKGLEQLTNIINAATQVLQAGLKAVEPFRNLIGLCIGFL